MCIVHNPAVTFWPPKRWTAHPKNWNSGCSRRRRKHPQRPASRGIHIHPCALPWELYTPKSPLCQAQSSANTSAAESKIECIRNPTRIFCTWSRQGKTWFSDVFWAPPLLIFKKPDGPDRPWLSLPGCFIIGFQAPRRCHGNPQGWAHQPWSPYLVHWLASKVHTFTNIHQYSPIYHGGDRLFFRPPQFGNIWEFFRRWPLQLACQQATSSCHCDGVHVLHEIGAWQNGGLLKHWELARLQDPKF